MQLTNLPSTHLPGLNEATGATTATSAKTGTGTGLRTGTQPAAGPATDTTHKARTGSMVGSNVDTTA
jgi:hypothetical protein